MNTEIYPDTSNQLSLNWLILVLTVTLADEGYKDQGVKMIDANINVSLIACQSKYIQILCFFYVYFCYLFVLLVDEARYFLETLFVVGFGTQVDDVGSETGHTTFNFTG